ncbi:hypothetical protein ASE67_04905 [Sphingomonas sp. Leaf23]|nr:hypothetical protein ASE67_04905 [Sphingomonas sp. Leaf23]
MIGGAAALFVANLLSYWAIPVVVVLLALCWLGLVIDGLVRSWRLRAAGIPALLPAFVPIVALPFAGFLASHALYWSHVVPSWWLLRSERAAFDRALSGGAVPAGVAIVERAGPRRAFPTVNGRAIVHDPTDRMAEARGWNGGPVAAYIRNVFGNTTIWCQRLDSHWFHCQFG